MTNGYAILTALLIGTVFSTQGITFSVDGINYNVLSENDRTVEVTYKSMDNNYRANADYVSGAVVIPEKVTYQDEIYTVTAIGNNAFDYCSRLTGITLPETIVSIGNGALSNTGLTELRVPESVTKIGAQMLAFDTSLVSVALPAGLTVIPNHAFMQCSSLTSVDIPAGVTSIGASAFLLCDRLNSIFCSAPTPPTLYHGGVFSSPNPSKATTLYVLPESIEAYRNAPVWQDFNILTLATGTGSPEADSLRTEITAVYSMDGTPASMSEPGVKIVVTPLGTRKVLVP